MKLLFAHYNLEGVLRLGFILFITTLSGMVTADPVKLSKEAAYYEFEEGSLNYKKDSITSNQPVVIKIKGRSNLRLSVKFQSVSKGSTIKIPKWFAREVRGNMYEIHVIPQSEGIFSLALSAIGIEDKAPEKTVLTYKAITFSQAHSFGNYLTRLEVEPNQAFLSLGLDKSYLNHKTVGIEANGFEKLVSVRYNPAINITLVGVPEGNCTSVESRLMENGLTGHRLVASDTGWSSITFYISKGAPVQDEKKERPERSLVFTYWVHFTDTISVRQWWIQRYNQFKIPSDEESLQEELYDYSSIDAHMNRISNVQQSIGTVCNYINQCATNDRERVRGAYTWMKKYIKYNPEASSVPDVIFREKQGATDLGQAAMFKGFMDAMGIECNVISGFILDSRFTPNAPGKHSWNVVVIDGKWRAMDVTWSKFLSHPKRFILSHYPTIVPGYYQLLNNTITEEQYKDRDYSGIFEDYDVALHRDILCNYEFNGKVSNLEGAEYVHHIEGGKFVNDRFKKSKKAFEMDGVDDYFETEPYLLGDFTFSMWVYVKGNTKHDLPLISKTDDQDHMVFGLQLEHGSMPKFTFADSVRHKNKQVKIYGRYIRKGNWQHIVVTRQGKHLRMYVNLRNNGHKVLHGTHVDSHHNIQVGRMKKEHGSGYNFLEGTIDDLKIYHRALTKNEIGKLFYENGYKGEFGDHY